MSLQETERNQSEEKKDQKSESDLVKDGFVLFVGLQIEVSKNSGINISIGNEIKNLRHRLQFLWWCNSCSPIVAAIVSATIRITISS
jgi:hypothetical protein